jgi:hypothetical protein
MSPSPGSAVKDNNSQTSTPGLHTTPTPTRNGHNTHSRCGGVAAADAGGGLHSSGVGVGSSARLRAAGAVVSAARALAPPDDDRAKYSQVFRSFPKHAGGRVDGGATRAFLLRSKLSEGDVDTITRLADADGSGLLDEDEFCFAMHLVTRRKKGESMAEIEAEVRLSPIPPNHPLAIHLK